jgi:DNA polymerase III delta subunit
MKISPDSFLLNSISLDKNKNLFFISGQEETLIQKILEIIVLALKKESPQEIIKILNADISKDSIGENSNSLFGESKILIYENPKKIDFEALAESNKLKTSIIIKSTLSKNSLKLKKFFDDSATSYSVSCYKLNSELKKKILIKCLNDNGIKIDQPGLWFFLENTDNRYGLFENELNKLCFLGSRNLGVEDLRKIISKNESDEVEKLFFLLPETSKKIINQTNKVILSSSSSYALLQRIKFFLNIFLESGSVIDASRLFPKYLFREKEKFIDIYKKNSPEKNLIVLRLIKKTELLLRKNDSLFLQITQRFLLNIKKTLN